MDDRSERIIDPVDGTVWDVDLAFLGSSWRCIWGEGCEGILAEPAAALGQGCCSVGAQLLDEEEAAVIGALGASLDPSRFQHASAAATGGVFADAARTATRVIDGACIFLNRPGFAGGAGCALHLGAEDEGEPPLEWKPSICWQLPLKIEVGYDGVRALRRWQRSDWGSDEPLAWCCTEESAAPSAFSADRPVAETLAAELDALVGSEVAVEIRRRLSSS